MEYPCISSRVLAGTRRPKETGTFVSSLHLLALCSCDPHEYPPSDLPRAVSSHLSIHASMHRIHRPGSALSERAQEACQSTRPESRTSCSRTQYAIRTPSDPWCRTTSNINTTAGRAEASTSTAAAITSPRAYPRRYRDAAIRLHANLPAATHTCCTRRQARAGGYGAADVWQRSARGLRSGRCEV